MLGCIALVAAIVGIGVFIARRRRQRQGDKGNPEATQVPNPAGGGHGIVTVLAAPSDEADGPSPARHEIPVTHNPAWRPLRQRSGSYSDAIDTLGRGGGTAGMLTAQSQVDDYDLPSYPNVGMAGQPMEPDSVDAADPNDGYIYSTAPGPPVMPPRSVDMAADMAKTGAMPQDQADAGLSGQQNADSTGTSAVRAAQMDHGILPPSAASVSSPASVPPASSPENQYAESIYSEIAEPVEDGTYEDISTLTFQKGTLERKMQLGGDGNLRLVSVRRTNPLVQHATPAAGASSIAPPLYEYDETINTGPDAIYSEPLDDDLRAEENIADLNGSTGGPAVR